MTTLILLDPNKKLAPTLDEYGVVLGIKYELKTEERSFIHSCNQAKYHGYVIVETTDSNQLISKLIQGKRHPLVLFIHEKRTMGEFNKLKEEGVDYILEQPVQPSEILALLRMLKGKGKKEEVSLPAPLVEKYTKTIPEKLSTLEELSNAIKEKYKDKDALIALRNAVHKIAGSAAAYGFGDAGILCKAHELFLYNIYSAPEVTAPQEEINTANEKFLRKIRLAFQGLVPEKKGSEGEGTVKKK